MPAWCSGIAAQDWFADIVTTHPGKILLIPLDERPVNWRYPAMIATIAGATVVTPPPAFLPDRKQSADRAALSAWIKVTAPACDACVLCLETLTYGGLIASRISTEPAWAILRWLADVIDILPHPLYASNVITRISRYNDAFEEPDYWAEYGTRLHAYSLTEAANGIDVPEAIKRDFLTRRARNHAINQTILAGAAQFDLLVMSSDDTAAGGLQARERDVLLEMRDRIGLIDRVLLYPGADEIGCTLTARLLNRNKPPRVYVDYAVPGGEFVTAKYEDQPVHMTVAGQLAAVGAIRVDTPDSADLILLLNPPSSAGQEWEAVDQDHERAARAASLAGAVQRAAEAMRNGQRIAIADVAYPNGSDPILIDLLFSHLPIANLAAYGAWNTAGNTIGSVLAACVPLTDDEARRRFLAHRFLEDWGYQHMVRAEMRTRYGEVSPDRLTEYTAEIAERLQSPLATLRIHGLDYTLVSVTLPWGRFFEVDFELNPR
jgi:hypothetical protein